MPKTKSVKKKPAAKKTIITKIAGQVGLLAGELVAGKDQLLEMAGDAIGSVKSTIQTITAKKVAVPKKAVKPALKKAIKKSSRAVAKKITGPVAAKKTAPIKKAIKKVANKSAGKK